MSQFHFDIRKSSLLWIPLNCKEIQPVHPKGDQSWVFIGRTDAEVETPILWPPHAKSWLIGKYPDAGRDWGQEEKGTTEDEMAEWHHRLNGREFGWTPGVGDAQGGLACCDSWGRKESDTPERLNWTDWWVCNLFFLILDYTLLLDHFLRLLSRFTVSSLVGWVLSTSRRRAGLFLLIQKAIES